MKAAVDQNMKKKVISVTDPGLLNRTAWTNAAVALDHIKKVGALVQCLCVEQCQCTRRRGQQGGTGWPLIETSPLGWAGLGTGPPSWFRPPRPVTRVHTTLPHETIARGRAATCAGSGSLGQEDVPPGERGGSSELCCPLTLRCAALCG